MGLKQALAASMLAVGVHSQSFTDATTGITFQGFTDGSGYRFGIVLPQDSSADFIGQIVCQLRL